MRIRSAMAWCGILLSLAACGAASSAEQTPRSKASITPQLTFPAQLPAGYAPITRLATDPTKPGVWSWSWTADEATAFFWDPSTQELKSWSLGATVPNHLDTYAESGLAVDPQGDLWIGANDQLLMLNPGSGAVERWTVPAPLDSPIAEAARPPDIKGVHSINGLGIDGHGRVVISESAAATLAVFDVTTQSFSTVPLPELGDILGLAVLEDGTIAVAMVDEAQQPYQADTIVTIDPGGVERTIQTRSEFVRSYGSGFIAGGIAAPIGLIDSSGNVSLTGSESASQLIPVAGGVLPDGGVVAATLTGVAIIAAGSTTQEITFPTRSVRGVSYPPSGLTTPPPGGTVTVQMVATAIAVDSAGNIWFTPNLPQGAIGLVTT